MEFIENRIIKDATDNMNMEIIEMKYVKLGKDWNAVRSSKSSYTRVYFVTVGTGKINCNGEEIILTPGNIYIIPSDMNFGYSCDAYLEKLYCHIKVCRLDGLDVLSHINKCVVLKNKSDVINKIVNEFNFYNINNALNIKAILYSIVSEAVGYNCLGEAIKYGKLVREVIEYIENNLSNKLALNELSAQFFVSSGKLQKQFKKEVGVNIGSYINSRIMNRAEDMLKYSEKPIKEISDDLGFCDQFYFSRAFSKHYGVPPKKYRDNIF